MIEDTQNRRLIRNAEGVICKELKDRGTMPEWIEFPIKDHNDFQEWKEERLNPYHPGRYPKNWEELAEEYKNRDYPLGIFCGSFYGWPRNWMGVERISRKIKRDPDFVEDIMGTLEENIFKTVSRALKKLDKHGVQLDFSAWWEDMCFNKGPLLSPEMFEEFMAPRYKRITELLEDYGINIHYVDCDGKIDQLILLWLEGGINCMFPVEAVQSSARAQSPALIYLCISC